MGVFFKLETKCQRESGQTDEECRCPANEGHDNSKPLWWPITEDERVEGVNAHRDDEEE